MSVVFTVVAGRSQGVWGQKPYTLENFFIFLGFFEKNYKIPKISTPLEKFLATPLSCSFDLKRNCGF